MGRTNLKVKRDRRAKVAQLYFLHNRSVAEICEALDWDDHTIYNDIQYLKKDWEAKTREEALAKLIKQKEITRQIAADNMAKASTNQEKRSWLRELREETKEYESTLMKVGIIKETPKQVENLNVNVDVSPEQLIKRWTVIEPKRRANPEAKQEDTV